ncbi:MAG: UDP-N-acetylmuramate--L-alanine ligase [Treponema sp.]|nr:UDP-N-acetylmuramate--L-alanine ligase [Treponema sp.]
MQNNSLNLSLPEDFRGVHIHFVGIKGTGMAALVEILFHKGAVITGSDVSERFYTDEVLERLGLKALPFGAANITDDVQYVIYSSAYKLDKNPDLIEAVRRGLPCLLYTQALGAYSERAYSCGICGVHGKTSTTGLVGTILKEIDLPSQVLAGSVINSFGGTCTYTSNTVVECSRSERIETTAEGEKGGFDTPASQALNHRSIFVAETCEYQRHFMSFCPKKIILTSVEPDHEDYYPTYEDIRQAFIDYICKLPQGGEVIYCADDKGACDTIGLVSGLRPDIVALPYGEKAAGDFAVTFGKVENERNSFTLGLFAFKGDFALAMPGRHEVLDAAAAVALVCQLLREFGKNPLDYYENIRRGLLNFSGGKRRSEIVGQFKNKNGDEVIVLDDYGHHPTAVKTTLEGYREFYKGRKIIVDFMSHTYSRTQALLPEFAKCFTAADEVILHKIYSSARENPADFEITGRTLYEAVLATGQQNVHYYEEILDAADFARAELEKPLGPEYPDGYLFITMGAGDNWKLGKEILK